MEIVVGENNEYDTGFHPEVSSIHFNRRVVGDFFVGDRFPKLVDLFFDSYRTNRRLVVKSSSLLVLDCAYMGLESLELKCPALLDLNCSGNLLKSLELNCSPEESSTNEQAAGKIHSPRLRILKCESGNLEELRVRSSGSLRELYCKTNQLTRVELNSSSAADNGEIIGGCESLRVLDCSSNLLTRLELMCHSLQKLHCSCNRLTKLKLVSHSLWRMFCSENLLTELELHCRSLRELSCESNRLHSLDGLEFCSELATLVCSSNLRNSVEILRIHLPALMVWYS